MSNQGGRQATVRASTGTAYDYNGDWHALFDAAGIAAGDFNGRMLQWINIELASSYPDINGAQVAFAVSQSFTNFDAMGTFSIGVTLTNRSIAENSANGTTLGTAGLPAGTTGTPTWSLTDALGVFQIDSATGVVTVLSNTNLDYETHQTIPITIAVSGVTPSVTSLNTSVLVTNVVEDTTPDAFSFTDITGAALSTVYTSNAITISGVDGACDVTVTGGTYSINGGAYTSSAGSAVSGDTITVRGTSSGSNSTAVDVVLSVGGNVTAATTDTFTITTTATVAADVIVDESGNVIVDESGNQILA